VAAAAFADYTDALLFHHGSYKGADDIFGFYVESLAPALAGLRSVVLDRCWISEAPYGKVYRNGRDRLGVANRRALERLALRSGVVVVECRPPLAKCLEAFESRPEMLETSEQLIEVYAEYDKTFKAQSLPSLVFDFTRTSFTELCKAVERERTPILPPITECYAAGNARATTALIVSLAGAEAGPLGYFGTPDSGEWMAEELEYFGVRENDLFWVAADDVEGLGVSFFNWFPNVYAIGEQARNEAARVGIKATPSLDPSFFKAVSAAFIPEMGRYLTWPVAAEIGLAKKRR
jgi:hypothetical protein